MFKRLALLLLICGVATDLPAQSPDLRFEHLTADDGLPSNWVERIYQDRRGFMWFATGNGLCKYDGYELTLYLHDPGDSTSIADNGVRDLLEDQRGVFWVGTRGGLDRFDPVTETFTHYRYDPDDMHSISSNRVLRIYEDRSGMLWIGTEDGGLNRFDPVTETFKRYRHDPDDPTSLSNDLVAVLYEDTRGALWIGTGRVTGSPQVGGLNRFDPVTETFKRYRHDPDDPTSLLDDRVTDIFEDARGRFWVGTSSSGLNRFDRATETFTRFHFDPSDPTSLRRPVLEHHPGQHSPSAVRSIHEAPGGVLWLAVHHHGLVRFNPATGTFRFNTHDLKDPYSPSVTTINSVYEARDGTYWLGTLGGGVNKVAPGFRHYQHDPAPPYRYIFFYPRALHEDASGAIWLGTRYHLMRWQPDAGTFEAFNSNADAVSLMEVYALHEDHTGVLWIGTARGLDRFDPEQQRFTSYRHDPATPSSLTPGIVRAIHEDRRGRLWIGTESGLDQLDRETGTFLHFQFGTGETNDPSQARVSVIFEDRQDRLWLGTGHGLYLFDPPRSAPRTSVTEGSAPLTLYWASEHTLWAVHEDRQGRFWIGTDAGLHLLDRERPVSTLYTAEDGLPGTHVRAILEDDDGHLWISTDLGLSRFDLETHTFQVFDATDGVPGGFNQGSALKGSRGELFFGSWDGLLSFYPDQIEKNTLPPDVVLTGLRIFDSPVVPGPLQLAHDQNALTFDYVGLHYKNPARNQYRYMLEHYDEAWVEAGSQRSARYTHLPPGQYVFRVQAANSDGVWNEAGASLGITITPPWWRTGWAYLGYGLLFLAGLGAASRAQRRRLLRQERERTLQRELEQARQIEAVNRQLRQHEQQLEDQNQNLLALDRAKSRFFANISHEFRTPLTLILGPLQDLLDEAFGALPEAQHAQLTLMQRNGRRLLRLINQLLDLARLEAGQLTLRARRADLVPLVKATAQAFASLARRARLTLRVEVPQHEILLYFEPDKLEKILFNLLSNAFKFTPKGGTITVRVEEKERAPESFVTITVRDTGCGIPAAEQPYIFDRFHQVGASSARAHEGTGIGLALTRELVALHGGTIRVESEEGVGTTFAVRLPRGRAHLRDEDIVEAVAGQHGDAGRAAYNGVPGDLDAVLPSDEQIHTGHGPGVEALPEEAPVILVVEDNDDVRAYLRSHLAGAYRLVEAVDGVEGLEQARALEPALVLSDVMMPRMDGYALCRAIKTDAALNHIPVVLLTAKADEESKIAGLETGADDYLYKPFNAEELLVRVENLIEIRRQLRAHFRGEVVVRPAEVTVTSADAAFLEQVRGVVEAHLDDSHFSVERLADAVHLSPRHLRRRLRALTQLSPTGYIRSMRLQRAAQLLAQEAGRVSEVAYAVGFTNAEHFSRLFQQVFSVAPSRYRAEQN